MPRVLTRCPQTGQVVPTRLSMDASTFKLIRLSGQRYDCPVCKTAHSWEHEDAWVETDVRAPGKA
ncbi:hypothetical protein [Phenylobacterium sp.]|uniref:hypothetical protein n=1 Tax=Phenylobacterium sp. TaxID=1871053 RepID=UPI0035AD8271